jgi:hypothetical protein
MPTITQGRVEKESKNVRFASVNNVIYRQTAFEPMEVRVDPNIETNEYTVEIQPGCFGPTKITATAEKPVSIYVAGSASYIRVDLP